MEDCKQIFKVYNTQKRLGLEIIPPFSTRFRGSLESILGTVEQTWETKHLHRTVLDAASAYFNKFVRGQTLMDGNKRLGVLFTHYFLLINGIDFTLTSEELYTFATDIAVAAENNIKDKVTLQQCRKIICKFTQNIEISLKRLEELAKKAEKQQKKK